MTTRPDLDLPWMLDPARRDDPGARPRLDATNLFLLMLREAYADGDISAAEHGLVKKFAAALKLDAATATKLAGLAKAEFGKGKLAAGGELAMDRLFLKACRFAAVDGEVDADERRLLASLGRGVGVTEEKLDELLTQALRREAARRTPGELAETVVAAAPEAPVEATSAPAAPAAATDAGAAGVPADAPGDPAAAAEEAGAPGGAVGDPVAAPGTANSEGATGDPAVSPGAEAAAGSAGDPPPPPQVTKGGAGDSYKLKIDIELPDLTLKFKGLW